MAAFPKLVLTNAGIALQNKVQGGAALELTSIQMGSGQLNGQPIGPLTALISPNATVSIQGGQAIGQNTYQVKGFFTNADLSAGFWWREIGIFANDPDNGEILYAYANAGDAGDYIPTVTDQRIEKYIYFSMALANATTVTVTIPQTDTYVLQSTVGQANGVAGLDENGAVPVAQGGTGATTPQNALETLGAGVRPRLGVNMDFKINQRGEDTYTASSKTYTVDGWYLSSTGMGCNVANDQITITPNGDRYASFIQNLEENFKGKTLTFSALVSGTVGQTVGIALFDNKSSSSVQYARKTYVLNERMNLITVSAQIPEDSPGQRVLLYPDIANGTSPATFYHAKPEEGEGQTLAYQDSDGAWHLLPQPDSDYATQLAKCQRYFRRFPANYAMGVLQAAQGKNNACFRYECNPPMRTTPAVSMQNQSDLTNAIDDGDSPVTPLSVTLNWLSNENVVGFYFSGASGTGGPGFVCNRYIDASAEL